MAQLSSRLSGLSIFKSSLEWLWKTSLYATFAVYVFSRFFSYADSDLYYIIPTGRYILENGIPYENPFTYVAGQSIVVQNWLYCVIVAFVYNHLHSFGLFLLQAVQALALIAVIFKFFNFWKSENKIWICLSTWFILFIYEYINLRPEMLTSVLIMVEINAIEQWRCERKRRLLLLTLPLSVLVNYPVQRLRRLRLLGGACLPLKGLWLSTKPYPNGITFKRSGALLAPGSS